MTSAKSFFKSLGHSIGKAAGAVNHDAIQPVARELAHMPVDSSANIFKEAIDGAMHSYFPAQAFIPIDSIWETPPVAILIGVPAMAFQLIKEAL